MTPEEKNDSAEQAPPPLEDFAGEIEVAQGQPPRWFLFAPYVAMGWALAYYVHVRASHPVNLVIGSLFVIWLVYTPIARRRGWFFLPL